MVKSNDEPPDDTNGSGTPVMGSTPTTAPMLTNAWTRIHAVTPVATSIPKRSGARNATRTPSRPEGDEQSDDGERAEQAELLADDGEDEVGVGLGEEAPLGPALAESGAEQAAVGDAGLALHGLEAGVERVGPGVAERHQPAEPVRLDEGEHGGAEAEDRRR